MMIPLRRALIVAQHGTLKYPEGTACAEVLKAGATAASGPCPAGPAEAAAPRRRGRERSAIFGGFGVGVAYKLAMEAFKLWKDIPEKVLGAPLAAGSVSAEISPEPLGVGYIIGPQVRCDHGRRRGPGLPGADPADHLLRRGLAPVAAAGDWKPDFGKMSPDDIRGAYVLYIGRRRGGGGWHYQPVPVLAHDRARPGRWPPRLAGASQRRAAKPRPVSSAPTATCPCQLSWSSGLVVLMAAILIAAPACSMNLLEQRPRSRRFGFLSVTAHSSRLSRGQFGFVQSHFGH